MVRITPTSLRRARTSVSPRIRLYGSAPLRDGESLPSGLLVRQAFPGGAVHFDNQQSVCITDNRDVSVAAQG